MLPRMSLPALLGAALSPLILWATLWPAQAGTIKTAEIIGSYDPSEVGHGARRGRDLPAVILGNPFQVPNEVTAQALSQGMRAGGAGVNLPVDQAAVAPLRVVWQLGGGTRTGHAICDRRWPLALGPMGGANLNVVATYCRGDSAMTQVYGSVDGVSDPRDPRFIDFISQMTANLFPPRNPDMNGDRGWRR